MENVKKSSTNDRVVGKGQKVRGATSGAAEGNHYGLGLGPHTKGNQTYTYGGGVFKHGSKPTPNGAHPGGHAIRGK